VAEANDTLPKDKGNKQTSNTNRQKLRSGLAVFDFLYNPESMSFTAPVNYTETAIPFTSTPQQNYSNGGAQTLNISDIYLDTYFEKKSLQPIIDKLLKLREPTAQNGILRSPPTLYFKWGEYRSFPCVLINMEYSVTHRINGYPVRAKLTLSFREVPDITKQLSNVLTAVQSAGTKTGILTDKQLADGKKEVEKALKNGEFLKYLPKNTQQQIKDKKTTFSIDTHSGNVTLKDSAGTPLVIGNYNGDSLKISPKIINKNTNLGGTK
jgi:hypothetical protein